MHRTGKPAKWEGWGARKVNGHLTATRACIEMSYEPPRHAEKGEKAWGHTTQANLKEKQRAAAQESESQIKDDPQKLTGSFAAQH